MEKLWVIIQPGKVRKKIFAPLRPIYTEFPRGWVRFFVCFATSGDSALVHGSTRPAWKSPKKKFLLC